MRPLQNGTLYPISASGSNFNPRNILYIPVVEIFAFLELEHKLPFCKGLIMSKVICYTFRVMGCGNRRQSFLLPVTQNPHSVTFFSEL